MTGARPTSAATAVAALALALGACGAGADRGAEASRQVHRVLADRFADPEAVDVDCPSDVDLEPETTVTCDVSVDGSDAEPVAFDVDEEGILVLASAVFPTDDLEAYLERKLEAPAEGTVEASCGAAPVLVGGIGTTFPCDAVRADGAAFVVTVEVATLDGQVTYDIDQVTATTSTTVTVPPG